MAEFFTDLKLDTLQLCNKSNASTLPTNSDSSLVISSDTNLNAFDNGKTIFLGQNIGNTYTLVLPSTSNIPLGTRYTFLQLIPLETDDGIIIRTKEDNEYLSTGSFGLNNSGLIRTSNGTCNALRIIGNDDNCQHGLGSLIDCQCVSLNKWRIHVDGNVSGTGSDAYSFDKI